MLQRYGLPLLALVAGLFAISCGGKQGDSAVGCSSSTYTPNYVANVNLAHFSTFPLTVYFDPGFNYSAANQNDFVNGINRWVTALSGQANLAFTVSSNPNAQIRVSFVPQSTLGGSTLGLTQPTYNPNTNVIDHSVVQIAITNIDTSARTDAQIQNTCAHEFGHSIGIFGHSPNYSDQMYAFDDGTNQMNVTTLDKNTILTAYCGSFADTGTRGFHPINEPKKTITIRD